MGIGSPSRQLTVELAQSVLEATETWFPFEAASDTPTHIVWAGGFVARCRQLLLGLTALVTWEADDAVGALYRTLLETYLRGVYALLGRESALEALRSSLVFETHQIEVALGRVAPEERPEDAKKLKLSSYRTGDGLVERVDTLLGEANEEHRGWAPDIHRNHYRVLSLHDSHGGFGCLQGHIISRPEEGRPLVVGERDDQTKAAFLLHHAIAHVGSFAGLWALQTGADIGSLSIAMEAWRAVQPDSWPVPERE